MLKFKHTFQIFSFCFIILNLVISYAGASPANNLQLAYDIDKQAIHIDANHPSDRLDRYYVSQVIITKNSKEKQYFYFSRQRSANKFVEDVDCQAQAGDHLDIELHSSEGGIAQGSIDVPKPEGKGTR